MLPSGSRSRASRHIHGWLRGPCSNGDPAARQLLDPLVEVVAFEIDCGRGDDLLFGVDLDREGHPARSLEPRVAGVGAADDLLEPEPAVEIDRALVIGAGHGHLVEPRARADVEPHPPLPDRPRALAEIGRVVQRDPDEFARPRHRVGKADPVARKKAIALASVQPVPWVLVVSIRWPCQLVILSVSISASASASPSS